MAPSSAATIYCLSDNVRLCRSFVVCKLFSDMTAPLAATTETVLSLITHSYSFRRATYRSLPLKLRSLDQHSIEDTSSSAVCTVQIEDMC